MNTEKIYYVKHPQLEEGPYDLFTLVDALNACESSSQAHIFCIGWQQWESIQTLPELLDLCAQQRLKPKETNQALIKQFLKKVHQTQDMVLATDSYAALRLKPWHHLNDNPLRPQKTSKPFWMKSLTIGIVLLIGGIAFLLVKLLALLKTTL